MIIHEVRSDTWAVAWPAPLICQKDLDVPGWGNIQEYVIVQGQDSGYADSRAHQSRYRIPMCQTFGSLLAQCSRSDNVVPQRLFKAVSLWMKGNSQEFVVKF